MTFQDKAQEYCQKGWLEPRVKDNLIGFYESYAEVVERKGDSIENHAQLFDVYIELVREQVISPYSFEPYHKRILAPFNYYLFGIEFLRPLLDYNECRTYGLEIFDQIEINLKKGHNVIFYANHQVEADPQAVSLLLEKTHNEIGENVIFVAGERVLTDPVAVPFSLGRNLLCIYSKRHIDNDPDLKEQKLMHNKKTMTIMREMLTEGGKVIYVAPSGGRDRPQADGTVSPAEFDPSSIEMFYLMAKKSGTKTHFHPLALDTYNLLPPPQTVEKELGEKRTIKGGGISLAVGDEINMEQFPGSSEKDKHVRRKLRADYIHSLVKEHYETL